MAFVVRWWGWAVFVALLAGVGAATHALVPVLPKLRLEGKMPVAITDDGATLFTMDMEQNQTLVGLPPVWWVVGPLRVWDMGSGRKSRSVGYDLRWNDQRNTELFSPDHNWIVYTTENGVANLVDLRTGEATNIDVNDLARKSLMKPLAEGEKLRYRSSFQGQNRYVFIHAGIELYNEAHFTIVELSSGKVSYQASTDHFIGLAKEPPVCLYRNDEKRICAFNLATGTLKQTADSYYVLASSPGGSRIALIQEGMPRIDKKVEIRDAATLELQHHFSIHNGESRITIEKHWYHGGLFSPDNRLLFSLCQWSDKYDVWEIATGKRVFTLPFSRKIDFSKCISPDSSWIALPELPGKKRLLFFDLKTGEKHGELDTSEIDGPHLSWFLDDRRVTLEHSRMGRSPLTANRVALAEIVAIQPDRHGEEFTRVLFRPKAEKQPYSLWVSKTTSLAAKTLVNDPKSRPVRWIDEMKRKLHEWIPALVAAREDCEITAFDLTTGAELGGFRHRSVEECIFAEGNPTLVTFDSADADHPRWTCVWDLPLRKPWRWVVGVPLALGAVLLGVRWTWRRWRAQPAA